MPEIDKNQDLTLQDIRVIIHGLKMSGMVDIEPEALDQVRFRIKGLPEAEVLNGLSDDMASLKRIAKEIGEIMHLLEVYRKKGPEFKARFESIKGLPPRYKVLDWRKANMNSTNFTRQLVKISSVADFNGKAEVSKKLLSLAKKSLNDELSEKEVIEASSMLSSNGLDKEAKIVEAAWWSLPPGIGKAVGDKAKQVGQQVGQQIGKGVGQIGQGIKTKWQGGYKDKLSSEMQNALTNFEQTMDTGVLLNEMKRLKSGWQGVNLNTNVKEKDTIQNLLTHIDALGKEANDFNNKMLSEFNAWINQKREQINTIAGSAAAPAAPAPAPAATPAAAAATPVAAESGAIEGGTASFSTAPNSTQGKQLNLPNMSSSRIRMIRIV